MLSHVDRARYLVGHRALAAWLWSTNGFVTNLLSPVDPPPAQALDRAWERLLELFERDLANVERGLYPRELLFERSLGSFLRAVFDAHGPLELLRVLERRRRGAFKELPAGVDLESYPSYYRRTFHWQTDGWLSDRSARLYDLGVEIVFAGAADVMRRMALPPLVERLSDTREPRVLDIACGTGRFLRALHRTLPHARLYGVDLSPFYAERARRELAGVLEATILAENAESLPFRDRTFDAATSIFLFHELPGDARRNVLSEASRVLKPGAPFVVIDSLQRTDPASEGFEYFMDVFPELYHEPYYKGYVVDDLRRCLDDAGFDVVETSPAYFATSIVARRR